MLTFLDFLPDIWWNDMVVWHYCVSHRTSDSLSRGKMANIVHTIFSSTFHGWKVWIFRFQVCVQMTTHQYLFRCWVDVEQGTAREPMMTQFTGVYICVPRAVCVRKLRTPWLLSCRVIWANIYIVVIVQLLAPTRLVCILAHLFAWLTHNMYSLCGTHLIDPF